MTEILFIRHGETDHNKKHLYYGHLNPSLNTTGINQLKNTKKKLGERRALKKSSHIISMK